ncbi:MAG: NAD(P)-binding protein [Candidatus Helarchaeota archaeon]
MKYDAIIIGAGIGGLAVNAVLVSNGYKTLLIEKNNIVGGRCSGFTQKLLDKEITIDYGN